MSNITPSPQSSPPNKSSLFLTAQKRSGFFNFGKIFKSSLLVGLGIFGGYLVITGKPEAGFAGIGLAQGFLSKKDDKDEKTEELEEKYQKSQAENQELRDQIRDNEHKSQLAEKDHKFQLELAKKDHEILILKQQKFFLEVNSQVPQLPEGQAPQFNTQQDIPQKQVTSEDLE